MSNNREDKEIPEKRIPEVEPPEPWPEPLPEPEPEPPLKKKEE